MTSDHPTTSQGAFSSLILLQCCIELCQFLLSSLSQSDITLDLPIPVTSTLGILASRISITSTTTLGATIAINLFNHSSGGQRFEIKLLAVLVPSGSSAAAKSLQSCPTLCDPIEDSPPGSPVPGILQARTLNWVAISFSNA